MSTEISKFKKWLPWTLLGIAVFICSACFTVVIFAVIISQPYEVTVDNPATPTHESIAQNDEPTFRRAVNVTLISMDGKQVELSDYEGQLIALNFWATWCPPCLAEMPVLQEAHNLYADDFVILAVSSGESRNTVERFTNQFDYTFPIFVDANDSVSRKYGNLGVTNNGLD